jgi:hypothetical protein
MSIQVSSRRTVGALQHSSAKENGPTYEFIRQAGKGSAEFRWRLAQRGQRLLSFLCIRALQIQLKRFLQLGSTSVSIAGSNVSHA